MRKVFKVGLVRHILVLLLSALVLAAGAAYLLWLALGSPKLPKGGTATLGEVYNGVKLAFAVVAGVGAVVALAVAYRKQRLQEEDDRRAELNSRRDDTKLYNERFKAAAEQLGSTKAAVRLSGVYAFQALADDWEEGRQMCVEVLAAYLRMPFPGPFEKPWSEVNVGVNGHISIFRSTDSVEKHDGYEELQVRLTIQGVFASRLRRRKVTNASPVWIRRFFKGGQLQSGEYAEPAWPNISAVLSGATLVDVDFHNCAFAELDCRGVVFYGKTSFSHCRFAGIARFDNAIFVESAVFSGPVFDSWACFADVNFIGSVYFNKIARNHDLEFNSSQFHSMAQFNYMEVGSKGALYFFGANFKGPATFSGTLSVHEDAFVDATAGRKALFKDLPAPWKNVGGKLVKDPPGDEHSGS
ncbi:pentapeptide repeat-containing protein [Micromonospora parva]|uniref:pentapeptide repeat-containing protein n=1 Tax=Micromonospora parva TaxID=1464048 RepID=UPI0036654EAA